MTLARDGSMDAVGGPERTPRGRWQWRAVNLVVSKGRRAQQYIAYGARLAWPLRQCSCAMKCDVTWRGQDASATVRSIDELLFYTVEFLSVIEPQPQSTWNVSASCCTSESNNTWASSSHHFQPLKHCSTCNVATFYRSCLLSCQSAYTNFGTSLRISYASQNTFFT